MGREALEGRGVASSNGVFMSDHWCWLWGWVKTVRLQVGQGDHLGRRCHAGSGAGWTGEAAVGWPDPRRTFRVGLTGVVVCGEGSRGSGMRLALGLSSLSWECGSGTHERISGHTAQAEGLDPTYDGNPIYGEGIAPF